jgi:uncharacterized membrane protein YdfJ with MMPL/SSD domain
VEGFNLEALKAMAQDAMSAIGDGIGVGADFIWPILVRQHFVEGMSSAILATLALLVLIKAVPALLKNIGIACNNRDNWNHSETSQEKFERESRQMTSVAYIIIHSVLIIVFVGTFMCNYGFAVKKTINPEYYAVKDVTTMMASLVPKGE